MGDKFIVGKGRGFRAEGKMINLVWGRGGMIGYREEDKIRMGNGRDVRVEGWG